MVSGLSTENIREAYSAIYPYHESVFTRQILDTLSGNVALDIMDLLPLPEIEHDITDPREQGSDLELHLPSARAQRQDNMDLPPLPETEIEPQFPPARAQRVGELFVHFNHQLAFPENALMISQQIGGNILCRLHPTDGSPLPVIAVSFYMASHLVGPSKPVKEIAEVVGISEGTIRFAYGIMYRLRRNIERILA